MTKRKRVFEQCDGAQWGGGGRHWRQSVTPRSDKNLPNDWQTGNTQILSIFQPLLFTRMPLYKAWGWYGARAVCADALISLRDQSVHVTVDVRLLNDPLVKRIIVIVLPRDIALNKPSYCMVPRVSAQFVVLDGCLVLDWPEYKLHLSLQFECTIISQLLTPLHQQFNKAIETIQAEITVQRLAATFRVVEEHEVTQPCLPLLRDLALQASQAEHTRSHSIHSSDQPSAPTSSSEQPNAQPQSTASGGEGGQSVLEWMVSLRQASTASSKSSSTPDLQPVPMEMV